MIKIDSHQHFWNFDPIRDSWIDDTMSVLQRDYLPDELSSILKKNEILGCVAVQASESLEENEFLIDLMQKNEIIKGVVGWLDLTQKDVSVDLEKYHNSIYMKGFRYVLQDKKPRDLILNPLFLHNLEKLGLRNFTYDILIFPDQLASVIEMVKKLPNQKFVLDHIAKPNIKNGEMSSWCENIKVLSKYSNVYCKVSGLVTEADWQKWEKEDFYPYLDVLIDAFGINRLMFGSDWPVCNLGGTYEQVVNIVDQYFNAFSIEEKERFYGLNTIEFYSLSNF
ncbi:amidohydrolase family protein [Rhizosphaericola mali]|uniref:Amidohydrolase family protein n=1 Tax=Rhizosphaericola mali TaxID=2545455 RepID=A0A5P2G0W6_9BACT|nr:amidohydrolase family protein [Rhizosphaericola mali]QES89075.1 amidohydrolase family protein [Rhizosphaericola mali]